MRRFLSILFILSNLSIVCIVAAQSDPAWCGYALIEGVPEIAAQLPLLSRLTVDPQPDSNPASLFQSRLSLDQSKALIEGCWLVMPTRDLIVNWLALAGTEEAKAGIEASLVFTLFAPDNSREASAASVRQYLREHIREWETQDE